MSRAAMLLDPPLMEGKTSSGFNMTVATSPERRQYLLSSQHVLRALASCAFRGSSLLLGSLAAWRCCKGQVVVIFGEIQNLKVMGGLVSNTAALLVGTCGLRLVVACFDLGPCLQYSILALVLKGVERGMVAAAIAVEAGGGLQMGQC